MLGFHFVENCEKTRVASFAPQDGHGGAGAVDDGRSSSNRSSQRSQRYSYTGILASVLR
jgi:hypothetical protein